MERSACGLLQQWDRRTCRNPHQERCERKWRGPEWLDPPSRRMVFGCFAKIKAVSKQNEAIAKLLVENGSDINAQNVAGQTSLLISCNNGYTDLVVYLLEHKVSCFVLR